MTPGEFLLGLALAAGALALAPTRHRALATRAHAALVLAALALLTLDFLAGTLRHRYAWDHTRVDYPWHYRLAGLWGGEEGTVLLWNAVVAVAILFVSRGSHAHDVRATRALVVFSGALTLFNLLFGTFEATSATELARAPAGRGLADVLLTPLMVVHPPIQFVGYGLMSVPAAYAIASLWAPARDGDWAGLAFPWARRAWLFATLGLGLGALWAYYVLSFGGYWAWDPVETSNLLPWLALTAFLHAGKQRMRGQGHGTSSVLLAYGAFVLTLFATFATRSGLWVSVHAFTDPTDRFEPDAPARLLAILDAHLPTQAFLGLLSAAALVGVALWVARRMRGVYAQAHASLLFVVAGAALLAPSTTWGALFHVGSLATPTSMGTGIILALLVGTPFALAYARADDPHAKLDLSPRTLLAAAVVVLSVALGVTFLLNLQVVNGPDRAVFDARAPFVALPIASLITLMLALAPLGKRGAVALAAGSLALGFAAAWAFPQARVFALALPVCAGATLAAVLKLAHVQGATAPRAMRAAGAMLLLSGILGLVLWSNPPTYVAGVTLPQGAGVALSLVGMALSTVALLGSVATFRGNARAWSVAGALAGALALGYGVGALLALAALALVLREPAPVAPRPFAREGVRVREMGIYLVHLAVILGLLGVAASTYSQEREVFAGVPLDAERAVGDYDVVVSGARVEMDEGGLATLLVPLSLAKDGAPVGEESLEFRWQPRSAAYGGLLHVRRALSEDVYVTPLAFHTPDGWVGADSAAGAQVQDPNVDAVTFSVAVLPLMSLVWAATWMMVLGMGFILAGAGRGQQR